MKRTKCMIKIVNDMHAQVYDEVGKYEKGAEGTQSSACGPCSSSE